MSKIPKRETITLPDIQGTIKPFRYKFTEWLDRFGFLVRDVWDIEKGEWSGTGWLQLFPEQHRFFEFAFQMNKEKQFKYSTVLYSTIKKSGKTIATKNRFIRCP